MLEDSPRVAISCDCIPVLLKGSIETENHSLLQSAVLTSLCLLNKEEYRQTKTLLDLQIIIDPLLFESFSSMQSKQDLSTSFYISHIGLLTLMRSWTGFILFCSDIGGFNTYIHILGTRADEDPQLAKEILLFLFMLLGIPSPSLLIDEDPVKQTSYWNECSLFINNIGFFSKDPKTNLLTSYLSLLVVVCIKAKLPDILISLLQHADTEIAYLSQSLLSSFTLLSDLFVPIEQTPYRTFISQSTLINYGEPSVKQKLIPISSITVHRYPIIQHSTHVATELLDYFSWMSLFHSILHSFCDNNHMANPWFITDYICNSNLINHDLLSQTLTLLYSNHEQFSLLLRRLNVFAYSVVYHF